MIKKLIWLLKHQEEIEKLLSKETPKDINKEDNFSTDGVPEFQKAYVEELLGKKK